MSNKLNVNLPVNGFFINLTNKRVNKQKALDYVLAVSKNLVSPYKCESVESIQDFSFLEVEKEGDAYALHRKSSLKSSSIDISFLFLEDEKEDEKVTSKSKYDFSNLPRKSFYVASKDHFKTNFDADKFQSFLDFLGLKMKMCNSVKEAIESCDVSTIEVDYVQDIYCLSKYKSDLLDSRSEDITEHFLLENTFKFPTEDKTFINISSEKEAAQLLNYLECKGYLWRSNKKPTEFKELSYFINKHVRINHDTKNISYSFSLKSKYEEESKKFFEFISNKANLIPDDEPFYVRCNSEAEADILLEALEAKGIKWCSGSKPTELHSKYNFLTYGLVFRGGELRLGFGESSTADLNLTSLFLGDIRLLNKESKNKQNKPVSDATKELQCIADALPTKWYVNTKDNNINLDLLFKVCDHLGINMASGANVRRFMTTYNSDYIALEYNAHCMESESIVILAKGDEPDEESTDVSNLFIDKQNTTKELKSKVQQIASKFPSKWYVVISSEIDTELLTQVCEHLDIDFDKGDDIKVRFEEDALYTGEVIEYGGCLCKEGLVLLDNTSDVDSDSKDVTYLFKKSTLTKLSKDIHKANVERGWYKNSREDGTLIMLAVSELAEAMEGNRKDLMDDHLPHRKMEEVELADAVIRILDYAAYKGYDIGEALEEKLEYNKTRADHDLSERAKQSGKRY